jgi:hypothetical protein
MDNNSISTDVNILLIERIEKVVEILQENSIKMGQLLAVHNEKLMKQDQVDGILFEKIDSVHREVTRKAEEIKKGCEKDIMLIDERLRVMEKKIWSLFGAIAIISFLVSTPGQNIIKNFTTNTPASQVNK